MYKLTTPLKSGEEPVCIVRVTDNTFIPVNLENIDYQQYLKWLAEGNTPEPADTIE